MSDSNMHVRSESLKNLQDDLISLSGNLTEIYDAMNADLSHMAQYWEDDKFDEFKQVHNPQIEGVEQKSKDYKAWANGPLEEEYQVVLKYEGKTFGSGGGSGVSGAGTSTKTGAATESAGQQAQQKKKKDKFHVAIDKMNQEMAGASDNKPIPPKPDSGFETPENYRKQQQLTPQQIADIQRMRGGR